MGTVSDKLSYLDQTKEAIKEAIINKGVDVSENDTFRSYAEKIGDIETGGGDGNIMPDDLILTPEKELPNQSEQVQYTTYTPPYTSGGVDYDGAGTIKVRKVGSWIDSEISADNIKSGKTILGVTGVVTELVSAPAVTTKSTTTQKVLRPVAPYNGLSEVIVEPITAERKTVNPSTSIQYVYPSGNYDTFEEVTINPVTASIDSHIIPENIKKGVVILGVEGDYIGRSYITEDINIVPRTSTQTFTPSGNVDGFGTINVSAVDYTIDSNIAPQNIRKGVYILGVEGNYVTENLQEKTVNPTFEQQEVTYDTGYDGLRSVTVTGVTPAIDPDIQPENIKKDIQILGVTGTYDGPEYHFQPTINVNPTTSPQIITPSEGYDALTQVNVAGVTPLIDSDIQPENIKAGIDILGVTGTYEGREYHFQQKNIDPQLYQQTIDPDSGFDALSRVVVGEVNSSIDGHIIPENIRKNVTILGVTGTLVPGEKQKWIDFSGIRTYITSSENTFGGGSMSRTSLTNVSQPCDFKAHQWMDLSIGGLGNINATLLQTVFGYDGIEPTNENITQVYMLLSGGYYYVSYEERVNIPLTLSYLYPVNNEYGVKGCLLNSEDVSTEKTYNFYLILDSTGCHEALPVLVDGAISALMYPYGYDSNRYITQVTVPAHDVFIPKVDENKDVHWVLKERKGINYNVNITDSEPLTVDVSAFDKNFGDVDNETIEDGGLVFKDGYIVKGKPSVTSDYWYSGFSTSNYLLLPHKYYRSNGTYIFKFRSSSTTSTHRYLIHAENLVTVALYSNTCRVYNWQTGNWTNIFTYSTNTWYWVKCEINGTTKTYYYSTNGNDWTKSTTHTDNRIDVNATNNYFAIGAHSGTNHSEPGIYETIDMKEFSIIQTKEDPEEEDVIVYQPFKQSYIKETSHEIIPLTKNLHFYNGGGVNVITTDNQFVNHGLTENTTNNTLYSDYDNKYCRFDNFNLNGHSKWKMKFHVLFTGWDNDGCQVIDTAWPGSNARCGGIFLRAYSSGWQWALSSDDSSWDIINQSGIGGVAYTNTHYYIQMEYDGIYEYRLRIAADSDLNNLYVDRTVYSHSIINPNAKSFDLFAWADLNSSFFMRGYLYMNDSFIYIGDTLWWAKKGVISSFPYGNLVNYNDDGSEVDMPLYGNKIAYEKQNFTNIGGVSISNKVASGFSTTKYLDMQNMPVDISSMEIVFKIRTPSSYPSNHQVILGQRKENHKTPQLEISNSSGVVGIYVTERGTAPWISVSTSSGLATNTNYWIKFTWDGTNIELLTSTDGSTYESAGTAACSNVNWSEVCFIGRDEDNNSIFTGSIDLSGSYIKINDKMWWTPYSTDYRYVHIFSPNENYVFPDRSVQVLEKFYIDTVHIPEHKHNWFYDEDDQKWKTWSQVTFNVNDQDTNVYAEIGE